MYRRGPTIGITTRHQLQLPGTDSLELEVWFFGACTLPADEHFPTVPPFPTELLVGFCCVPSCLLWMLETGSYRFYRDELGILRFYQTATATITIAITANHIGYGMLTLIFSPHALKVNEDPHPRGSIDGFVSYSSDL